MYNENKVTYLFICMTELTWCISVPPLVQLESDRHSVPPINIKGREDKGKKSRRITGRKERRESLPPAFHMSCLWILICIFMIIHFTNTWVKSCEQFIITDSKEFWWLIQSTITLHLCTDFHILFFWSSTTWLRFKNMK